MKRVSPSDYIFATGKIRALEKFLIKKEVFEEAIDSGLSEALKLFAESGLYSDGLLHLKDSQQLESILGEESLELKELIGSLLLDKKLLCLLEWNDLNEMKEALKDYGSEFLSDYLTYLIDMHNIKTFVRFYILKEPQEKLSRSLVSGGFIDRNELLRLYEQSLEVLLIRLEYVHKRNSIVDYAFYLAEAIRNAEKNYSFVALEKAINDFLIEVLKQAKRISFGPEPLLAYYFARMNEINLIRMIIMAKLNDMPKDLIVERLNSVYA